MKFSRLLSLLALFAQATLFAQKPQPLSSSDIHQALRKLNVLGSALYVAAHPDDENTRFISYLVNEKHINTCYLSLTRGDGGQNLIGTEIEELLGVIRTQELLAARRLDGGNQMFSRANDFGFSKHPDETLRIWDKDQVTADVVWAIRKWQPDVIVNRFSRDNPGSTHGHHTASAWLGHDAFDISNDPKAYPEQLKHVGLWQPRRIFFNTSWWFYGSQEKFQAADKTNMVSTDAGVYFPLRGMSNNEISAESRSLHKSQGFGSTGNRGEQMEYLDQLKGDKPSENNDIFAGIDITWGRVGSAGKPIGELLKKVEQGYRHDNPAASVPDLLRALKMIEALPDGYWKRVKLEDIRKVIGACMGLYIEAIASDYSATPGQEVNLTMEVINRSPVNCTLQSVRYLPNGVDSTLAANLAFNKGVVFKKKITLPADAPYTNAYWLDENWALGMYTVKDQTLRGLPETPRSFKVQFNFLIENQPLTLEREVAHKFEHDVKGEVWRPFEVTPPVFVNLGEEVYMFGNEAARPVSVTVKSGAPNVSGKVTLALPQGWRCEPASQQVELKLKGEEKSLIFQLYPPKFFSEGKVQPSVEVAGKAYHKSLTIIEYPHIPTQTVLLNSEAKIARIDLKKAGERIAYIMGAGDKVPENLRQIGYTVDVLEDRDITPENLRRYDAVLMGIRAYNTIERLKFQQPMLLDYAKGGGTLIVQYNTNHSLVLPAEEVAPYKLKISRERTTVEEAEVRLLAPDHEALNFPNKITAKDFEGWVQERGLYFPNEWGPEFTPLLSCNDPGEPARDGALLVAKHGEGYYVYTGISFFRELPSGVTGAYRLLANLISLGKKGKP